MLNTNNEIYWKHIKKVKNNAELCFIHTPKCGGSFAGQIFNDLKIRNKLHVRANKNDGITFTIIRHPVERFESLINYRLGKSKPRGDWPKHLEYVYNDKSVTLNEIVDKMSDKEILGFTPYQSLEYWSKNIDVFITIDNLHNFLSFFGYNYKTNKYSKTNVSKKRRGKFNEVTRNRVAKLYFRDILLFNNTVSNKNTISKYRIAVCTWYNVAIKHYADLARKINEKYCSDHGYTFIACNKRRLPKRHPSWECMPLLAHVLQSDKHYDAVMWIDADACFSYRCPVGIEYFIENNPDKDIILSDDITQDGKPNCGVMLLRNTPDSLEFCKLVVDKTPPQCMYSNAWEQCSVRAWLNDRPSARQMTAIVPWGPKQCPTLQTFPYAIRSGRMWGNALVLHAAGSRNAYRIDFFSQILRSPVRPIPVRVPSSTKKTAIIPIGASSSISDHIKIVYVLSPRPNLSLATFPVSGKEFEVTSVRVDHAYPPLLAIIVKRKDKEQGWRDNVVCRILK